VRYRLPIVGIAVLTALLIGGGPAAAQNFGEWAATGSLNTGRFLATTALLPNGEVLIAGGITSQSATPAATASSELYNPSTGTWVAAAPMGSPRAGAVAVGLKNGDVLVAGGAQNSGATGAYNTAEFYDPTTNVWTATANTMSSERGEFPTATLLNDGDVLVAGGVDSTSAPQASADIYDPTTNSFTPAAEMEVGSTPEPRFGANAVLLNNGDVLVAGGVGPSTTPLASALVYDPTTNTWTAPLNAMSAPHGLAASGLLPDGDAIITGGESEAAPTQATTTATDLYQPATNSFVPGPPIPGAPAIGGYATVGGGRLIVAGGVTVNGSMPALVAGTEIYDPTTNSWDSLGALPEPLAGASLVTLANGQVLAAGGSADEQTGVTGAELLTPTRAPGAPQTLTATAGNRTAQLTFAPPSSDGGSTIEHYTVTASTGQTVTTPDGRTFATFTGLTNGKPVSFTVTATNELGTGTASSASSPVTPEGPPSLKLSKLPSKLKLKAFLKGISFKVTPNQPVALQVSLFGRVGQATIASAYDLTLASASTKRSAATRTIKLVPSKKLTGKPRKAKVEVVIVATAATGLTSTTTKTISVSG
jgi:N-acetylneuraminic acid mutarotase